MVRNIRKDGTYPEYGCSFPMELFWFKAICEWKWHISRINKQRYSWCG